MEFVVGALVGFYVLLGCVVGVLTWLDYRAWKTVRADIVLLNQTQKNFESWSRQELGLRKAMAATDEDLARQETRIQRARRLWSAEVQKVPEG